jgi:peptidoglycan-associated lipoprotein
MNPMAHRVVAPLVLIGVSALVGCAREHASPTEVPGNEPASLTYTSSQLVPGAQPAEPQPAVNVVDGVHVSDEILKACEIHFGNADAAPKFDFDKSDLRSEEHGLLQEVATCVTTGPLKGRPLNLVGRADPRGEVEYNFLLGESRAGSVSSALMQLGVDSSQLSTTSRGKLDAIGTDEVGWQRDRRVDIDLQ